MDAFRDYVALAHRAELQRRTKRRSRLREAAIVRRLRKKA